MCSHGIASVCVAPQVHVPKYDPLVGTVEVASRLEVMSNGIFLALVLVGDYRDFT